MMIKVTNQKKRYLRRVLYLIIAILFIMGNFIPYKHASAQNPPPFETYFVPLPDDWLMQHMEDIDNDGGSAATGDPAPPVRSVIGISISANATYIYWDQWEDGGYDAQINEPGTNIYNASTNPDGTQIWGDNDPSNGYPPRFRDQPNTAQRDLLYAGDVIVLDNLVPITSSGGTHGPWLNGRNPAQVFYDGKDKFAASLPVSATRAGWSEGDIDGIGGIGAAGSMFSDATAIEPTKRWGTYFITPIGYNPPSMTTPFDYAHVTIQAQQNSTTVCVDVPPHNDACDGTGDRTTTINQGQQFDPTTMPNTASPQGVPHGTEVRTNYPVQVILVTGDVGSTWATRWYNIKPFAQWTNDYYQPVGTSGAASAVWVYNPNDKEITITIERPSGTFYGTCAANSSCKMPDIPAGEGGHGTGAFTDGSGPAVFYPVSVTEATGAQLYDWGYTLIPSDQLSDQVLVGWAPGCTTVSGANECFDNLDTSTTNNQVISRSPVWVTPLADTTIYVDLDGGGVDCSADPVTGAERTIAATALTSYTIVDDPVGSVCDAFEADPSSSDAYNDNYCNTDWTGVWTEGGGETTGDNTGAILINTTSDHLRFVDVGTTEAGRYINRSHNLSAYSIARLKFTIGFAPGVGMDAIEDIGLYMSSDGTNFTLEERFDVTTLEANPLELVIDISNYISANTTVRFQFIDSLEEGEYWYVDDLSISFSNSPYDFDMSGARLVTCDGTRLAAAYGQQPSLSYSGDDEALDMGTTVFPLGSNIEIEKSVDPLYVTPGGEVTYTYRVWTSRNTPLELVTVTDDYCYPATYVIGDDGDNILEKNENWYFTCTASIFVDTTNTATAQGSPDNGVTYIQSEPDQAYVRITSAIGDYIWVDEDGDGDQDAGEPGIPNVKLTLTGFDFLGNPIELFTYTDADGRYIFPNLPPSDESGYTITVDTTTLPAGLAANHTYDEDGNLDSATTVVLDSGVEYMTADFGYNWSSTTETNTITGTGAIGDRVWIDADGDGVQDSNEAALEGVEVQLWYDSDGDGVIDSQYNTTPVYTDAAGNYIFDDLPAGIYQVIIPTPPTGYTQTGDPDETTDNQTTTPIILAPGDVFLNADFGYMPATSSDIGDTIYFDSDGDGTLDAGEPGISGVSVALIDDLDGDGVWDEGEPIIATDITDENGLYLFPGLPAGDYIVWVNDTANVLNELEISGDPYGDLDGFSKVAVNGTDDNLDQDFGYYPPSHLTGTGVIGDTIFLDSDGGLDFDPGEGLEGVVVILTDDDGNFIARTVTDENGNYSFGNLPAGDYIVTVDTSTLPAGLTNTVDPDGGLPNESNVSLIEGEVDLDQDFGYRDTTLPNSVGGTIWEDMDADGTQDLDETTVFPGVTVDLYYDANNNGILDAGDELVGTTATDSNGEYSFGGLPDGTYFVDVTDDENLLEGYWHSLGTQGEADDGESKVDAYAITLSGGEDRETVDFGYYIEPAGVGNLIWTDSDGDGIQDVGEAGIPNYPVYLTITYPDKTVVTIMTYTDEFGYYSFDNLLLDEDFDGIGEGEPTYKISVPILSNTPTLSNQGDNAADSDGINNGSGSLEVTVGVDGEPGLVQGLTIVDYDFGFTGTPTSIELMFFSAAGDKKSVTLTWETASEIHNLGFNIYRAESLDGERVKINPELIPSNAFPGSPSGAIYEYIDTGEGLKSGKLVPNRTYYYWLEQVDTSGGLELYGPVEASTAVGNKKTGFGHLPAIGEGV